MGRICNSIISRLGRDGMASNGLTARCRGKSGGLGNTKLSQEVQPKVTQETKSVMPFPNRRAATFSVKVYLARL